MFKRFGNVFKFTFHNQVSSKSFKVTTILITVLLFLIPVIVFVIAGNASKNSEENKTESCGADKIYVVNERVPDADYSAMNSLQVENYTELQYVNAESVDAALREIEDANEVTSLIVHVYEEDGGRLSVNVIVPDSSPIDKKTAGNLCDFLEEQNQLFTVLATGISVTDIMKISAPMDSDVYSATGYAKGRSIYETDKESLDEKNNENILPTFNMILVYATVMLVYFIVLAYGASITQNIVMEKASKLMDTMLISVRAESLIFGKLLGVLTAAFIQLFAWIAAVVVGMIVGLKIFESIVPGKEFMVITFLKSFAKLGLFKPLNVILAVLVFIFGIVLYCALAAIGGAISSTKEEAASNQSIFVILLVVCFYLVLIKGLNSAEIPTWLYIFPGTGAMVLPAGVCAGVVSTPIALASFATMVVTTVAALWLAGKIYVMMSLYKGNGVRIGKALKMLFSGNNKETAKTE